MAVEPSPLRLNAWDNLWLWCIVTFPINVNTWIARDLVPLHPVTVWKWALFKLLTICMYVVWYSIIDMRFFLIYNYAMFQMRVWLGTETESNKHQKGKFFIHIRLREAGNDQRFMSHSAYLMCVYVRAAVTGAVRALTKWYLSSTRIRIQIKAR